MNIRCSVLPSYTDCARRAAAKTFGYMLKKAGFDLPKLPPPVGAAAGTSTHKAAEVFHRAETDGQVMSVKDAVENAMVEFDKETSKGCVWDTTTPNRTTAQIQIERMTKAYLGSEAAKISTLIFNGKPAIELALEANLGDDLLLTGHIDRITIENIIRDLKTGALLRPYYHQLGGYSLLSRSNKILVNGATIDFVKRTPKTKPQAAAIEQIYPVAPCERAAMSVINRIKADLNTFKKTGNPESFPCNPMSMMCTEKYCPAFGTDFCELTKK
jgi:hypothetical protein